MTKKPRKRIVSSLTLSERDARLLAELARRERRSMSNMAALMVAEGLERRRLDRLASARTEAARTEAVKALAQPC